MSGKERLNKAKVQLIQTYAPLNSTNNISDIVIKNRWRLMLYLIIILSTRAPLEPELNFKLPKFLGYGLLLLVAYFRPSVASAIEPLPPDSAPSPQPQPLPSGKDPLDESLEAPPIPESLLDIPGTTVVKQFQFAGNTAFSQTELNRVLASFTHRPISFAQLVQAADIITQFYVSRGYITSGAYIPEQNSAPGIVQIQIVEGVLADIEVKVAAGRLKPSYIRDRLISQSVPLNIDKLQEALQLLQFNPLIESVNAELSTGIAPGTNSLTVSVVGADTFKLETVLNNNRNLSIGTFERGVELEEANLLGIGDRIRFGYHNTEGSDRFNGGYAFPLNSHDGNLRFDFQFANNEIVQSSFEDVDIDIESRNYSLTWQQPIWRQANARVNRELALDLSLSRRESDTTILDIPQPLSPGANLEGEIRTSTLSLGQEWLQRGREQVFLLRSQFNVGLDVFDAVITESEPNSQFFNWRGQLSYLRLLDTPQGTPAIGPTILLRSQLQLSADSLISTEQFSLGGGTTVRGYRQDALLTDNGFFISAELRLPIARLSRLNTTLQFSPFIDYGMGWNTGDEKSEFDTLLGMGFGMLLQSEDRLSARLDWGIPLLNEVEGSSWQENGVYLEFNYDLF
jgi:hemolysin activation/secretion protein